MKRVYPKLILLIIIQFSFLPSLHAQFGQGIDLDEIDGQNGLRIINIDAMQLLGSSVSHADDYNDDGISDIIFGAPGLAGKSYVLFGSSTPYSSPFTLTSMVMVLMMF